VSVLPGFPDVVPAPESHSGVSFPLVRSLRSRFLQLLAAGRCATSPGSLSHQAGHSIGISSFQPDYGNKFLTYAAPAIHNAMLDYIRRLNPTFEAKNLDCIIRLDEVKKGENKGQHEFIADSRVQNPEQIFIAKETHEEIHTALEMIDEREKAYLWYRFGFEDDVLHPLSETAKHFHLSESRAKSTEKLALDNFWLELPWWY